MSQTMKTESYSYIQIVREGKQMLSENMQSVPFPLCI